MCVAKTTWLLVLLRAAKVPGWMRGRLGVGCCEVMLGCMMAVLATCQLTLPCVVDAVAVFDAVIPAV